MKIVKTEPKVNENAVKVLESALKRVNEGEIASIAISWVTAKGGIGGDGSSGGEGITMWASMIHNERSFYNDVINPE